MAKSTPLDSGAPAQLPGTSFGDDVIAAMGGADVAIDAAQQAAQASSQVEPTPEPATNVQPDQTVQQPSAPASAAPVDPFLAKLAEFGFQDLENLDQARERLFTSYEQQQRELEQLRREQEALRFQAQYAEQLYNDPQVRQVLESRRQPQQTQQAPVTQQPAANPQNAWWNPPKVDLSVVASFRERRVDPATSEVIEDWKPNTPLAIRNAWDEREAYLAQWSQKLVHNPVEALQPIQQEIRQSVVEEVRSIVQQEFQNREIARERQEVQTRINEQDGWWLYEIDPRTNKPATDQSGNVVFSQLGRAAAAQVDELERAGISDPGRIWDLVRGQIISTNPQIAARALGLSPAQQAASSGLLGGASAMAAGTVQAPVTPTPVQQARNRQNAYLRQQAAPPPNRNGADVVNGQARRADFGETVVAELERAGVQIN